MMRHLIVGLFVLASCAFANAQVEPLSRVEVVRTRISHVLDQTIEIVGGPQDPSAPSDPQITAKVIEATQLIEDYFRLTHTKFDSLAEENKSLRYFHIQPDTNGSWLNGIAHDVNQLGLKFYIRPAMIMSRKAGEYDIKDLTISVVAPPFTGRLSATMAHELAHYVVITESTQKKFPHLELVTASLAQGFIEGYPQYHLSEMTALAAGILDFGKIPYSEELSKDENRRIQDLAVRLYRFANLTRVQVESYLEGSKTLNIVPLFEGGEPGLLIQNSLGSQIFFENLDLQSGDKALTTKLFKRFLPTFKITDSVHVSDAMQADRRLKQFYDIVVSLENKLLRFAGTPANRIRVHADKPWTWLQEANSSWLAHLNYPKDHPSHSHVNQRKDFILCASGKDPVCKPISGCENLLE